MSLAKQIVRDPIPIVPKGRPRTVRLTSGWEVHFGGKRRRSSNRGALEDKDDDKDDEERDGNEVEVKRRRVTCSRCGGHGHNKRGCHSFDQS
jgi:hypothetical protein